MSQITERINIIEIKEITSIPEANYLTEYLSSINKYKSIQTILSDIHNTLPKELSSAVNVSVSNQKVEFDNTFLSSPNTLRAQFKKVYTTIKDNVSQHMPSKIEATKASVLATISIMSYKVEEEKVVRDVINALVKSRNKSSLKREIESLMHCLEVSHTKVFTSALSKACVKASLAVGFKEVEVKKVYGKLEVIATNSKGQRLISEIDVHPKTRVVNMHTETIGMTDRSCSLVMNQFNDELRKMGIKIENVTIKFTGGSCQMPYAKIIDQQDKEQKRKKKELERLRKLNIGQKQKQK